MMMVASFCHFVLSRRNKVTQKKTNKKKPKRQRPREKKSQKTPCESRLFAWRLFAWRFFVPSFRYDFFFVFSYGALFVSIHGVTKRHNGANQPA